MAPDVRHSFGTGGGRSLEVESHRIHATPYRIFQKPNLIELTNPTLLFTEMSISVSMCESQVEFHVALVTRVPAPGADLTGWH